MEMEYHEQPFHFLNYYLLSALYADPTKDVDALIHGFCRVYGGGAAEMEAAIGEIRRMQNAEPVADKQEWHQRRLKWITAANYEKLADLFERAYAKAGSENARLHVLLPLKKTWKDLVGIYKKDPFAEAKYKLAQEKYLHFGKEWAKTGFIENTTRAKREADVQDDIDLLTLRFTDLPEELKDVPAKDVVCIDYHGLDHKSPDPKAFRGMCNPIREDDASVKLPFSCGVYDWNSKESFCFTVTPEMLKQDGNYHWVKLGKIYVGRNSGFWYPGSWRSRANLRPHHVLADGLKEDPNWCELWVSFKVDGPKFVPGSKECDMIAVDRLALRRIKK